MSRNAIVMAAPNGARRTPADHPALPVAPDAIAEEAALCRAAGATVLHLHVRNASGEHTLDPMRYRAAFVALAETVPDMIVQVTSEAAGRYRPAEQAEAMRQLAPEALSVALREMVPDAAAEPAAADFYAWAASRGIAVQHILYAPDEVRRLHALCARGVIPPEQLSLLFVLGAYRPARPGRPDELDGFLAAAEGLEATFAVCAFGAGEHACISEALRRGGHVRVGFENNLDLPDGTRASRSADLVALAAEAAARLGRGPADVDEARAILGLPPRRRR